MARGEDAPAPVGEMDDDGSTWTKTIWIPTIDQADIELMPDEEGMTKQMAIKERAITAGEQDLPSVNDTILDKTQMEVCKNIFDGILLLNQFLASELGKAVQVASSRLGLVEDEERLKAQIDAAVDGVVEDNRRELTDLRETDLQAERNLKGFAARNDLLRPARIKDHLVIPISSLLLMFVVESLVNGFVLAEVSDQGVMGGAIIAGVISAVNIGLGILSGLIGWRNAFHVKVWRRVVGWGLAIAFLIAAFGFNLLVAHFREAAELIAANEAAEISMAQLNADTLRHLANAGLFGLSSPLAWGLFVLGVAIHVVATKEGYEDLADPYWGYGSQARLARDASDTYDEAFEGLRHEIRGNVEHIENAARLSATRAGHAVQGIKHLKNLALQRRQEVLDSEDVWVVAGNTILKMYRDQNLRIRPKGPSYFNDYPSAEDYRTGTFGVALRRSSKVEAQDKLVDRHIAALDELIDDAAGRAKGTAEIATALQRTATERIRNLDGLLTQADEAITAAAFRRMDDGRPPNPDATE
jgi:hypothetical protein